MRQKERPGAKENAGEGGGNGMLIETEEKASKGECWQGREGQQGRMLVRAEGMEC